MNFIQFKALYNIKTYDELKKVCERKNIKIKELDNRIIFLTEDETLTKINKTIIDKRNLEIISYCGPTHITHNIQTAEVLELENLTSNFNKFTITDLHLGTHLKFYYFEKKWRMALFRQIESKDLEINGVKIYKLFLDNLSEFFKDYKFKKSYTYCFTLLDKSFVKMRTFVTNSLVLTNIYTKNKSIRSNKIYYYDFNNFSNFSERCKIDISKVGFMLEYNNLKFNIFCTHFDKINSLMVYCKDLIEGYFKARTNNEKLDMLIQCYECGEECIKIERLFRKFSRYIHILYMSRYVRGEKIPSHSHKYIKIIKSIHKLRPKDCKIRYRDVLRIMGRSLSDNNKSVMKPFRYYYKENSI